MAICLRKRVEGVPGPLSYRKLFGSSYGFFVAVGFLLGIGLAVKEARRKGIPAEKILDLSFYIILSAIVGSRLLFVIINYPHYLEHPLDFFKVWEGGLVFYGGLILSFLTGLWTIRQQKLPFWETADLMAPSIAIGQVFGRLGCFAAGCCFGKATDRFWGVTFNHPDSLAPTGIALHPTQLYEALAALIIFFILWGLRDRQKFAGMIFLYLSFFIRFRSLGPGILQRRQPGDPIRRKLVRHAIYQYFPGIFFNNSDLLFKEQKNHSQLKKNLLILPGYIRPQFKKKKQWSLSPAK